MSGTVAPIGRRDLLGLAIITSVAVFPWRPAGAQTSGDASATAPIEQLDSALLAAMKAGSNTPFDDRYRALTPVIEQVFNLDAVLAASIGLSWATLPAEQKPMLAAAFRRYTISSYATSFSSYNGRGIALENPLTIVLGLPGAETIDSTDRCEVSHLGRSDWKSLPRAGRGWTTLEPGMPHCTTSTRCW
jgi:MlaC protein